MIQDFTFPVSTSTISLTADQRYIIAAGIYAPQIKIFDTGELSLKCMRGVDSEVVAMKVVGQDYSKVAMVEKDRSIDIHAQYGNHYKTRIPHYPRDLEYNAYTATLLVSASAGEIYRYEIYNYDRLSLEEGKFLTPFHTLS